MTLQLPDPDLQVNFAASLGTIRHLYLQDALSETVRNLSIPEIDQELAQYVHPKSLASLAGHQLRGETLFPVPVVLTANPYLLGYYRLVYGYSQKEFYTSETGMGQFKSMEARGKIRKAIAAQLPLLCKTLCGAGALLLAGINSTQVSAAFIDDLSLLTLGPQLRGGANVKKGAAGIRSVLNTIHELVRGSVVSLAPSRIEIKNAAGRTVLIEFAADPDIVIREQMRAENYRQLIAIEVKAGEDFANIHNRIGEAEKSHQKARKAGFVECWTVVNVDRVDLTTAHHESPSTNRFYKFSDLMAASGQDYQDFRDRIISLTGIK
jgi:XcyI restriction endonuclease